MFSELLLNSVSPKAGDFPLPQDPSAGHSTFLITAQALEVPDIPSCLFPSTNGADIHPTLIQLVVFFQFLWSFNGKAEREVPRPHQSHLEPYKCALETLRQLNARKITMSSDLAWSPSSLCHFFILWHVYIFSEMPGESAEDEWLFPESSNSESLDEYSNQFKGRELP